MMTTSSMVMGSVLWMEGVGLGLARNIVQRYALETGSEQSFGIGDGTLQARMLFRVLSSHGYGSPFPVPLYMQLTSYVNRLLGKGDGSGPGAQESTGARPITEEELSTSWASRPMLASARSAFNEAFRRS